MFVIMCILKLQSGKRWFIITEKNAAKCTGTTSAQSACVGRRDSYSNTIQVTVGQSTYGPLRTIKHSRSIAILRRRKHQYTFPTIYNVNIIPEKRTHKRRRQQNSFRIRTGPDSCYFDPAIKERKSEIILFRLVT